MPTNYMFKRSATRVLVLASVLWAYCEATGQDFRFDGSGWAALVLGEYEERSMPQWLEHGRADQGTLGHGAN